MSDEPVTVERLLKALWGLPLDGIVKARDTRTGELVPVTLVLQEERNPIKVMFA